MKSKARHVPCPVSAYTKQAVTLLYDGWKIAGFLQSARCQIVSQSNLAALLKCRTAHTPESWAVRL